MSDEPTATEDARTATVQEFVEALACFVGTTDGGPCVHVVAAEKTARHAELRARAIDAGIACLGVTLGEGASVRALVREALAVAATLDKIARKEPDYEVMASTAGLRAALAPFVPTVPASSPGGDSMRGQSVLDGNSSLSGYTPAGNDTRNSGYTTPDSLPPSQGGGSRAQEGPAGGLVCGEQQRRTVFGNPCAERADHPGLHSDDAGRFWSRYSTPPSLAAIDAELATLDERISAVQRAMDAALDSMTSIRTWLIEEAERRGLTVPEGMGR